jgi:hypothetical protein
MQDRPRFGGAFRMQVESCPRLAAPMPVLTKRRWPVLCLLQSCREPAQRQRSPLAGSPAACNRGRPVIVMRPRPALARRTPQVGTGAAIANRCVSQATHVGRQCQACPTSQRSATERFVIGRGCRAPM